MDGKIIPYLLLVYETTADPSHFIVVHQPGLRRANPRFPWFLGRGAEGNQGRRQRNDHGTHPTRRSHHERFTGHRGFRQQRSLPWHSDPVGWTSPGPERWRRSPPQARQTIERAATVGASMWKPRILRIRRRLRKRLSGGEHDARGLSGSGHAAPLRRTGIEHAGWAISPGIARGQIVSIGLNPAVLAGTFR